MERQRFVETLRKLHQELTRTEGVDPETLSLLRTLIDDIQRVVSQREDEGAEAADADESAPSSLRNLLLKFEAEHPELATAIGKVADGLAAMGF